MCATLGWTVVQVTGLDCRVRGRPRDCLERGQGGRGDSGWPSAERWRAIAGDSGEHRLDVHGFQFGQQQVAHARFEVQTDVRGVAAHGGVPRRVAGRQPMPQPLLDCRQRLSRAAR
jgi:hypothetical protein